MSIDARIDKLFHIEDQQVGDKKLWSVEDRKVITLWQGEGQNEEWQPGTSNSLET